MSLSTLNNGNAVGAGEFTNCSHFGWPSAQMHHGNGLSARGDQRLDSGGCDGTGIRIHLGEDGLSTQQHSGGGGGNEGARRGDQLITLAKADGEIGSGES